MKIEQFTRGENPFKSLNIGKRTQIENWFKTWAPNNEYEIDNNLNIKIKNSLCWLHKTKITSLPNYVGGFLNLSYLNITSLPDNLHIEGGLNLEGSKITSLPDNLHIEGSLDIRRSKIISLPDNLQVEGEIYKDFDKKRHLKH